MVEITVASGLGPSNRNVSFQTSAPPSDLENQLFERIKEILGAGIPDEFLRESIRKRSDLNLSEMCISGLVDEILKVNDNSAPPPIYGPEKQSTATDTCMEMVPYVASSAEKETSDLQKAIQDSMNLNDAERINLEELVRNPNISTGLKNSGNTCWFNCLAQMLYSLSSFRSVIYHCVPVSWTGEQIVNIRRDDVLFAELLLGFRKLFADLYFTEMSYIEVGDLLKTVEALHRKNRSDSTPTIGNQQDATEMLILIFEWLETALNAAVHAHLNPDLRIDNIDDNIVVAESTTEAPNSEMAGTAPPDYSFGEIPSSGVKREAQSRPNSPLATRKSPEFAVPLAPSGSRVIVMKNDLSAIDEAMDTSEGTSRIAHSPPFPAKMPRIRPAAPAVAPEPSEGLKELVDQLKLKFEQLFTAKLTSSTISDDNSVTNETHTQNCPQIFQLQLSYGNLHDALEASTYDTGRNAISHVQNLYEELPAVIFMGLSRFVFENSASIKLHDRFTFPRNVYMDRYLKSNAEFVEGLRSQQNEHREELARLRAQRNGVCRYPHGNGGETKLADVFETAIQALMNANGSEEPSENIAFTGPLTPMAYSNQKSTSFVKNLGKIYPKFPESPEIENTIKTLQTLKLDVMNEENNFSAKEMELEDLIENTYEVEELQKHQYELRAMIVHSGEANIGHYFTYRLKKSIDGTEIWEKLNDQKTDQVTWPQVESDAFGSGSGSPSAYLLMYVRSDATWLDAADTLTAQEALAQLPSDLAEYVEQQQKSWKSRLQNYREQQEGGVRKEDSAFTWCRKTLGRIQGVRGDENANPEITEADMLRIPVYKNLCTFNDAEINEVLRLSSHLWNNIVKIEPHRFASPEELLAHHLRMAMVRENGGVQFMESLVNYPLRELREDAENDVERICDNFFTKYLDSTLQCKPASSNSNLLLFVRSRVDNINISVIRFLLVVALTHSEISPISERAEHELKTYCDLDPSSMKKMRLVILMLSQAYEIGIIAAHGARRALQVYCESENRADSRVEDIYVAMTSARLSRVCSRHLSDLMFLKPPANLLVAPAVLQIITIIPLLKLLRIVYQNLSKPVCKLTDLEFFLTHNERRVNVDLITSEMEFAIHAVHSWFREVEHVQEAASKGVTANPMEIDIKKVYTMLCSTVELMGDNAAVMEDVAKSSFISRMHSELTILALYDEELPSDLGSFEPETLDVEDQKIFNLLMRIGQSNDKVDQIISEIQQIISGMYG